MKLPKLARSAAAIVKNVRIQIFVQFVSLDSKIMLTINASVRKVSQLIQMETAVIRAPKIVILAQLHLHALLAIQDMF